MEKLPDREFGGILAALIILNGCAAPAVNDDPGIRISKLTASLFAGTPHQDDCFGDLLQAEGTIQIAESVLDQNGAGSCEKLKELEQGVRFRLRRAEESCILYQMKSGKKDGTERVMKTLERQGTLKRGILQRCSRGGGKGKDLKIPKDAVIASN